MQKKVLFSQNVMSFYRPPNFFLGNIFKYMKKVGVFRFKKVRFSQPFGVKLKICKKKNNRGRLPMIWARRRRKNLRNIFGVEVEESRKNCHQKVTKLYSKNFRCPQCFGSPSPKKIALGRDMFIWGTTM